MPLRKSNMCRHKLDVHEANASVSQFHRIRNHCSGCWTTYGWVTCFWDIVIEVLRSTNDTVKPSQNGNRETGARPRSKVKTQNDKRNQCQFFNCQMWIVCPLTHIRLKVNLSCTFLKTMNLSSKWFPKYGVQR